MTRRSPEPRVLRLTVSGAADLVVEVESGTATEPAGDIDHAPQPLRQEPAEAAAGKRRFEVMVDGWRFEIVGEDARAAGLRDRAVHAAAAQGITVRLLVRAQIPGRVTRIWVEPGDQVEMGQRLLAIEAMKMENEIRAPRAGTVESVAVTEGGLVELNNELLALG